MRALPSATLTPLSKAEVFFWKRAAVRAFPMAISTDAGKASFLWTWIGTPPASLTQIETHQPLEKAAASAAAMTAAAPEDVRQVEEATSSNAAAILGIAELRGKEGGFSAMKCFDGCWKAPAMAKKKGRWLKRRRLRCLI